MPSYRPEMLDLAVVVVFVALALWHGMRARRQPLGKLEQHFVIGWDVSGWKSGLSMSATQHAADTPLPAEGLAAARGLLLLRRFWICGFNPLAETGGRKRA